VGGPTIFSMTKNILLTMAVQIFHSAFQTPTLEILYKARSLFLCVITSAPVFYPLLSTSISIKKTLVL
jgi:hypothetical protein